MAIEFNHTILSARDSKASADFLAEMLGLPAPRRWGPFYMVRTDNDANLDYMDKQESSRVSTTPSWLVTPSSMRSLTGFRSGS